MCGSCFIYGYFCTCFVEEIEKGNKNVLQTAMESVIVRAVRNTEV